MSTRWVGTLLEINHGPRTEQDAATNSWRAWLMSGARHARVDSRRAQGADVHLKRILIGSASGAIDFSNAMARQAIDEGMRELPLQDKQIVKLAYFGGLTNREIAHELGLTVGGVRRRLRQSLATLSTHVGLARAAGRKAVHSLVFWLCMRRFGDRAHAPALSQIAQAGAVAAVTIAAAALVAVQAPSFGHFHRAYPQQGIAAVPFVKSTLPRMQAKAVAPVADPFVAAAPVENATHTAVGEAIPASLPVIVRPALGPVVQAASSLTRPPSGLLQLIRP